MRVLSYVVSLFLGVLCLPAFAEKITLGQVETGLIGEQCIPLHIRMDTGAQTSSVNAHNIQIFQKEGQTWVRFILDPDRTPKIHEFELPLVRMVSIRKRAIEAPSAENFEERPVVHLPLVLGKQTHTIEVNLTNRSFFNYGMILGRSAMEQFDAVIDPTLSFTIKPVCPSESQVVD